MPVQGYLAHKNFSGLTSCLGGGVSDHFGLSFSCIPRPRVSTLFHESCRDSPPSHESCRDNPPPPILPNVSTFPRAPWGPLLLSPSLA